MQTNKQKKNKKTTTTSNPTLYPPSHSLAPVQPTRHIPTFFLAKKLFSLRLRHLSIQHFLRGVSWSHYFIKIHITHGTHLRAHPPTGDIYCCSLSSQESQSQVATQKLRSPKSDLYFPLKSLFAPSPFPEGSPPAPSIFLSPLHSSCTEARCSLSRRSFATSTKQNKKQRVEPPSAAKGANGRLHIDISAHTNGSSRIGYCWCIYFHSCVHHSGAVSNAFCGE